MKGFPAVPDGRAKVAQELREKEFAESMPVIQEFLLHRLAIKYCAHFLAAFAKYFTGTTDLFESEAKSSFAIDFLYSEVCL